MPLYGERICFEKSFTLVAQFPHYPVSNRAKPQPDGSRLQRQLNKLSLAHSLANTVNLLKLAYFAGLTLTKVGGI